MKILIEYVNGMKLFSYMYSVYQHYISLQQANSRYHIARVVHYFLTQQNIDVSLAVVSPDLSLIEHDQRLLHTSFADSAIYFILTESSIEPYLE